MSPGLGEYDPSGHHLTTAGASPAKPLRSKTDRATIPRKVKALPTRPQRDGDWIGVDVENASSARVTPKVVRLIGVALVAIIGLTGCTTGNSVNTKADKPGHAAKNNSGGGSSSSSAAKIGDALTVKGMDTTVSVTATKFVPVARSTDQFMKPGKGKRYVAVQFQITNKGSKAYDDSPSNGAKVIDGQGQQYDASMMDPETAAGPNFPASVKIVPGGKALGFIVFEVPMKAKITQVQFAMDSGFSDAGQWNV